VVEQLFETFDRLRNEIAIIVVDHHLDLALALSDSTVALQRGRVIHQGPSKALRDDLDLRQKVLWLQIEVAKSVLAARGRLVTDQKYHCARVACPPRSLCQKRIALRAACEQLLLAHGDRTEIFFDLSAHPSCTRQPLTF